MRLLIVTQVVDTNDSNLGFFHRWIEEFAKHCEHVTVICLKEGKHQLPPNVGIYSLGKEKVNSSRFTYARRFRKLIREHSGEYDAVFVHMNPEYVLLGGFFWRAQGKKIALWYVHKSVTWTLRIALHLSDVVFRLAGKFPYRIQKVRITGHGIDTGFFSPAASVARGTTSLSVGRLMQSKQHNLAIRAAYASAPLRIAGEGPERERLAALARELGANVTFLGGLTQEKLRDEYRTAAKLVHRPKPALWIRWSWKPPHVVAP
jgi:glycosyltransferase involved in cell wall biosynthesis